MSATAFLAEKCRKCASRRTAQSRRCVSVRARAWAKGDAPHAGSGGARRTGDRPCLARRRRARARARHEAAVAKDAWRKSVNALEDHLRAIYEQGEPDAIAVLLGATSVDDAMTRLDALERSARLNRLTIEQARDAQRSLARLRRVLELREQHVQQLVAQAEQTAAALAQARAQRVAYIS